MHGAMKTLRTLALPALLALAACGANVEKDQAPKSPIAGNWSEVLPDDKHGMTLTFSDDGSKVSVHGRPHEDGSHGHPKATVEFNAETKVLTLTGKILDGDKAEKWVGTLGADGFSLKGGETKLKFKKGGEPHGH